MIKLLTALAMCSTVCATTAVAATCHIVVAADRASSAEIFQHELAHCNGWEHKDQHHGEKPRAGYRAPRPPARFIHPYHGKLIDHWVSTATALEICNSYGCQW